MSYKKWIQIKRAQMRTGWTNNEHGKRTNENGQQKDK